MIPAPLKNADCLFLAKENYAKTGSAFLAAVKPEQLPALAKAFYAAGYHLEDVSGLAVSEGAVSVYHFDHFDAPGRCTVLALAPHGAASFPSIADVYQGAEWHERETRDFYGFDYPGNPNLIPLLMPETMPDVHPLQKEEGARASLAALFSAPGREREIVSKADGFTALDVPVAEKPAEEAPKVEAAPEKPAEKAAAKAAPKAEQPEKSEAEAKPAEKPAPKAEKPAPKTEDKKPAAQKAAPKAQGKAAKAAPKKAAVKGGDNA